MSKEEFLSRLEQLLSGISEEERSDALAFYRSYFEDAGEGNEASIIKELESPEKVAEAIKANLGIAESGRQEKMSEMSKVQKTVEESADKEKVQVYPDTYEKQLYGTSGVDEHQEQQCFSKTSDTYGNPGAYMKKAGKENTTNK